MDRAINSLNSQYRGIWFLVEVLPIPSFFQVAMMLSLGTTIPGLNAQWLATIPLIHVLIWAYVLRKLKRSNVAMEKAITAAMGERRDGERMRDRHIITARSVLPQLVLFAMGALVVWMPCSICAVAYATLVALAYGMVQTLRVIVGLAIARS